VVREEATEEATNAALAGDGARQTADLPFVALAITILPNRRICDLVGSAPTNASA
jgi:hypothetical protein